MKVALQLYSIRDILPGNIEKCIAEVAEIGYDGVEIVNFGGDSLNEIVSAMRNNDLQVFSIHTDIHEVIACDAEKLNYYAALGCRYMPISALPDDRLPGGDKYEETLCAIRNFSETAQGYGIKLLYHNHDFDFEKAGGRYKLDILYSDLPASILGAELDTCWIYTAGESPLDYYKKYSDRCPILHLKDCVPEGGRKGFRELGGGVINFGPIIKEAKRCGTEWLCIEQDDPTPGMTSMECAEASCRYLKNLDGVR